MKPFEKNYNAECPHCKETEFLNDGTGTYQCPDCGEEIEITLRCPKCAQELIVKEWGDTECTECHTHFNAWKESAITPVEDAPVVICIACKSDLPHYIEISQAIKNQIPWKAFKDLGPIALNAAIFGPHSAIAGLASKWHVVLEIPDAIKALNGTDCDALNVAHYPCPKCKMYIGWEEC